MKIKICLLAIGICLVMTTRGLADLVAQPTAGPCPQVTTTDFQGQVCSDSSKEYRTGQWIEEEGGVFIGNASVEKYTDGKPKILIRDGNLTTSNFQGKLRYQESKDSAGKLNWSGETLLGTEKLPDGVFEGNKTISKNQYGPNLTYIIRDGNLTTSNFQGKLRYQESRDSIGTLNWYAETLDGIWRVTPSTTLHGNLTTTRNATGGYIVTDNRIE